MDGRVRAKLHAVWDVKYHVIWVTKCRYKVLRGEVAYGRVICCGRYVKEGKW